MNIQTDVLESRKPPHSIEAEQALLGAMLMNNEVVDRLHFLNPHHFFEAVHERIYEHILAMREKLQTASPITLKPFFESDPALAEVGGSSYLGKLATSAVNIFNIEELGKLVVDMQARRQLIAIGEGMVNTAYEADIDISSSNQIETSEQQLFDLSSQRDVEGGFKSFSSSMTDAIDLIEKARKSGGKVSGKTTGLRLLNHKIGGFHDSDLIVLAGRPGMGKTALATSMAFYCAQALRQDLDDGVSSEESRGAVVGFFSLEMSADQLATRILSQQSQISSEELRKGNINTEEFQRVAAAATKLQELPFFIDDTAGISISALRARARRLHRRHNLGVIVVDYLQLLQGSGANGRAPENRVQEISEITRGLKNIAKSLRVPVIALSQLSRAVEQREDKKPQLSDLRESGTIEQDADIVLFVYRESYYHMRKMPDEAEDGFIDWQKKAMEIEEHAEIDVAKHRHGSTGAVKVRFNASSAAFEDLPDADPSYMPEQTRQ